MLDYTDPDWRAFASERTKALHIWPNQMWHHNGTLCGALVVMKPRAYDEYAVSKAGLDYLFAAHQVQRITSGHVVLACWRNGKLAVVATKPVSDVVAALAEVPPRDGPFGPYWWVCADFTPDGGQVLTADEVPF
jgi:hypothetical protein